MTEGVNAFAQLRLVRSGDLSGSTVVTVTPRSGTATGIYHDSTIQKNYSNHMHFKSLLLCFHVLHYACY